ncbi:FkbM family methyltransferase [Actinomadura formosensis]|uniref:FkbM family methyltransferase n=1 Tax=Actinomadura formosensis TaxID=60706 RepID=UPI00082EB713|nr:FkbM family methyltransferase [Actinomadura formosensis]
MTAQVESNRAAAAVSALCAHPAVADAAVRDGVAYLVPDPDHAPMLHRAAGIEADGGLGTLAWHEPSDDLRVAGVNRAESDFLYREIFADDTYFRSGVTLPPGAVVVDAGANIGMFTLRVARRVRGARIIAVEPVAELAAAVEVNARLHGLEVTVAALGLGRAEADADFTFYPKNTVMSGGFADSAEDLAVLRAYLLTDDRAESGRQLERLATDRLSSVRRSIRTTTLSRLAREHGLDRIDLLKIDVEKAEVEVLEGIDEALWPRIDQIVMEVHDLGGRLRSVVGTLRARGFEVTSDQDRRLVRTPCFNVFARRPAAPVWDAATEDTGPPAQDGPTQRILEVQLKEMLRDRFPGVEPPARFEVVSAVGHVVDPATAPGGTVVRTHRTQALAAIWSDLFGPDSVRPDANFFDLGGDSLTAVRMLGRLEDALGEDTLAPDMIFTLATFGALADAVEASVPTGPHPDDPS